jgi:2-succinyl-5-enolpyruvyl-6-hydroxy-3-cyclohexene-1-carboxylate synthase
MSTDAHTVALTRWVGTLIAELLRGGVTQFVVCPGSRSTPLALAVARHPQARIWMQLDERSAGFFALGMARQRREPVALICTSGTAVANLLPAVAEADLSRVPLILLNADRPHELRDNGAPQTIDQLRIFGSTTRWATDLPTPGDAPGLLAYARTVAARAIAAASGPPAGPVQLNAPFREPLVPDRALLAEMFAEADEPAVGALAAPRALPDSQLDTLAAELRERRRGLILCGPDCPPRFAHAVAELAAHLEYPILADPLSGVRCGSHDRTMVLSAYDAFLRDEAFAAAYGPELVLRFGAMPTAKPLLQLLQRHPAARTVVVDEGAGWREPTNLAALHLACDPLVLCEALAARIATPVDQESITKNQGPGQPMLPPSTFVLGRSPQPAPAVRPDNWLAAWLTAERVTRETLQAELGRRETITEPGVFAQLAELLPDGATLFVGNSMPVRDCDTFFPTTKRDITIAGNRGANGIDGLVSTALGAVAGGAGPLLMALGDLSLYHDSNGLLAAKLHDLSATIVLINNDGGGIFSFLPQASEQDRFELLFGTPHGLNFRPLAELYGAQYSLAADWASFREAVAAGLREGGLRIVEVRTERERNVADHRALWPKVSAALQHARLV